MRLEDLGESRVLGFGYLFIFENPPTASCVDQLKPAVARKHSFDPRVPVSFFDVL